ncbi:hypothetical protein GCM10009744_39460 [Kribbella alba]|uniref:AMIN-like domain-containing protein n=1 Tax=Kribbella alba TaxID=190197 RepID=A0ABN2FHA9_9ACTN
MKAIRTIRKPIRTAIAVLAVAAVPAGAVAIPAIAGGTATASTTAASTATSCSTKWGSLPKASSPLGRGTLTGIRTGRHACFDRIVFDVSGKQSGSHVRYVSNVYQDGSGFRVPLRGGAKLEIIAHVPDYNDAGRSTYRPANRKELTNVAGYRTFRQVAYAGSFEGQTTIGLGVRARLPFRVFTVAGPGSGSRIVVDVAHTW